MKKSFIKNLPQVRGLPPKYRLETGFSMLEAVVVVGVLLALAVSGFFSYGAITENAKMAKVKSTASSLHTAVVVASVDGDANTNPQDVIDNWNDSTKQIRAEIIPPAGGGASANGDFCVAATNVESPHITAQTGACIPGAAVGDPNDTDGDGIPNSSDPDIDGDGIPNESDTTPNGGTSEVPTQGSSNGSNLTAIGRTSTLQIAGWGGDGWAYVGSDAATTKPTDYVLQGALAAEQMYLFSVNTNSYHACGVGTLERELYCWGNGYNGQLGDGLASSSDLPVKVGGDILGKAVSEVGTGGNGTCAIANNGLYCWGTGYLAGGGSDQYLPLAIGSDVLAGKTLNNLIVGDQFGCVLANSAPYCWGTANAGSLGEGTTGSSGDSIKATPVPVDTSGALAGKTVTALGAMGRNACAIADGGVYCWGKGEYGQNGDGTRIDRTRPVAVLGELVGKTAISVAGGYTTACATTAEGTAYCWGRGNDIGNGTTYSTDYSAADYVQATPVAISTSGVLAGKTVTQVGFGDTHTCVLASNEVYCWGEGDVLGGEPTMLWTDNWGGYWYESYPTYDTPQKMTDPLLVGKVIHNIWLTGGGTLLNYTK